jgi:hypothetical protein
MARYLSSREEWLRLHDHLMLQHPNVGLDTEGEGFKDVGAKRVTVWSIAGLNGKVSPRGYSLATGYVLPAEALRDFRPLLESPSVTKWLHNAPADTRSIHDTTSIVLQAARCTLQYSRVAMPGMQGYGLKALSYGVLGKPYRPGFASVMGYDDKVVTEKVIEDKSCACGEAKCRKRKLPMHEKTLTTRTEVSVKIVSKEYRPEEMHPAHTRWQAWVDYAAEDAVDALELASYLSKLRPQNPGDPFSTEVQCLARSNEWRLQT